MKNKLRQERNRKARQLATLKHKLTAREIKQKTRYDGTEKPDSQINTRASLLPFYLRTGGADVGSMDNFFGFPGGKSTIVNLLENQRNILRLW